MNSLNNNAFSGPTTERFEATKATQSEAVAGSDNKKYMTPLRTFQAVAAWIAQNLSTFPPAAHGHPTSEVTGLDTALDGKLNLSESSCIIAKPGDNLAAKYTAAKALTPNGAAKSAPNRASLVILPGRYTLSAELAIDAEFVDVIGLGAQTHSPSVIISGATLNVSADDVKISGISVGTQSFKITGDKPSQVWENCTGGTGSFGPPASGNYTGLRIVAGTFPALAAPPSGRSANMRNCLDASGDLIEAFVAGNPLMTGLQAFYKLSDTSDSSGNNRTLTNNGNVSFASGKLGNAAVFDGNYLSLESLTIPSEFSISFWCNIETTVEGEAQVTGLFGTGTDFFCHTHSDGQTLKIQWGNPYPNNFNHNDPSNNSSIALNEWTHVVIGQDSEKKYIYTNNVKSEIISNGVSDVTTNITIGAFLEGGVEPYVQGSKKMDAFGIWNRALSDSEVAALYNSGNGLELP